MANLRSGKNSETEDQLRQRAAIVAERARTALELPRLPTFSVHAAESFSSTLFGGYSSVVDMWSGHLSSDGEQEGAKASLGGTLHDDEAAVTPHALNSDDTVLLNHTAIEETARTLAANDGIPRDRTRTWLLVRGFCDQELAEPLFDLEEDIATLHPLHALSRKDWEKHSTASSQFFKNPDNMPIDELIKLTAASNKTTSEHNAMRNALRQAQHRRATLHCLMQNLSDEVTRQVHGPGTPLSFHIGGNTPGSSLPGVDVVTRGMIDYVGTEHAMRRIGHEPSTIPDRGLTIDEIKLAATDPVKALNSWRMRTPQRVIPLGPGRG